ncbi:MAG: BtaA family protein [Symploca sp. SIO2D2]|nr:BtaA family protein [Symploca sp. SIO2D2]
MTLKPKVDKWLDLGFSSLHRNNLVYVTCWEDPRLDRIAMKLTKDDTVLVLTSGGCNALDYALDQPQHIYAVDVNPRQNSLLELKIAGIRELDYASFFQLFGEGHLANFKEFYQQQLRTHLSPFAQQYWDSHGLRYFAGKRPFFFHGTTGIFAQLINFYIDHIVQLREELNTLLEAKTIEQQRQIYYDKQLNHRFWRKFIRQVMNSDLTLWMLGVPPQQRQQMERYLTNGVAEFVEERCREVFSELPIGDNYFWQVFIKGKYTPNCCPEYLKEENFQLLKAGLVDCISTHTDTVAQFLEHNDIDISHFVLLDHMDWLSNYQYAELEREWQAIVNRSGKKSRILFRSACFEVEYLNPICVSVQGRKSTLADILEYEHDLAQQLHPQDRVHTYGSFYIADLVTS